MVRACASADSALCNFEADRKTKVCTYTEHLLYREPEPTQNQSPLGCMALFLNHLQGVFAEAISDVGSHLQKCGVEICSSIVIRSSQNISK